MVSLLSWPYRGQSPVATALPPVKWGEWDQATPANRYALLRAYSTSNGIYSPSAAVAYQQATWQQSMKALRNVGFRVIEFHAAHLWPGTLPDALPIETENERIIAPIQQVWTWSNWASQKQVAARWLAMLGDVFIKVAQPEDRTRVHFELIDPVFVSDFSVDTRGYLTWIRVDIPQTERRGDKTVQVTHTEVWDKAENRARFWVHDKGADADIARLGTPLRDELLTSIVPGMTFLPFVHVMFRDVGDTRGQAAIWPALEKIDEANLKATRLSQLLFRHNNVNWALRANGMDATGRPLPPPSVNGTSVSRNTDDEYTITMNGERFMRLPGTSTIEALVPNINYEAALSILNADMLELEHDLPELAYARISEQAGAKLSGRAIRFMLTPAIDRVIEARGNAEAGLIRAQQMALTIGAAARLPGFAGIGDYASGAFDHSFAERDVIPTDAQEESQALLQRAQATALVAELLAPADQIRIVFPELDAQEIERMVADKAAQIPEPLQQVDRFMGAPGTPVADGA